MSRKNVVSSSSINFVTIVVYVSFLLNLATAVKPRGFSMKMIRSDSKESPMHLRYAKLTQGERFQRLVEQSKARAHYFGSARAAAYNRSISMDPDIARMPVKYRENTHYYIGEVGIGTFHNEQQPFKKFYLLIDSGSDLIWTQCHGGHNYFYQDPPIYDQENSRTYHRIPCQNLNKCDAQHCEDGLCTWDEEYMSGSEISGHLAYETLTLNSHTGALESVEKIIMGCGIDQRNFGPFFGVPEIREGDHDFPPPKPAPGTAPIAGILGLGQGSSNFSLVLQLDIEDIQRRFEYCLEAYDLPGIGYSHTYLRFGFDAKIEEAPDVLTTPIIQDPNFETPYHLILKDISINDRSLRFQQSDFELKSDGTGGTIIDSGAPFTTMRMRHFKRVKQALVEYFVDSGIPLADPEPGRDFDTCFVLSSGFAAFPEMTFHFQDADFVIRQWSGIFAYHIQERLFCLGIIGLDDDYPHDVIFGAMQQADKRIMYDLHAKVLKFTHEQCDFGS
ncbi:aspartic proteinase CDR1-like [Papaver somniferum]|uniref:aspartic proteinase CDR1-like n=1 Tax=Papaver somniferum TaxID=3469 RepID=UPI000E6F5988|nr:aspartic proteinase CDR1-like [Papaver somniferum]